MATLLPDYFAQNWKFLNPLVGGGQATTCVVRNLKTGAEGVLKLPKELTEVAIQRFQREIEIVQSVQHPAIIKLLDYSLDPVQLGYVSPRGKPLNKYWPRMWESLSPTELYDLAYRFMESMAGGLALLHDKGVVHRDLKASNVIVMVAKDAAQPVVIDFGLAFREGDQRLSPVEGKLVKNLDAAPAEAYYRHITPTPAWDCIGLGWLYGYLVGAGKPDNNRFHWKYHPLIQEQRGARLRGLLAACSDIDYAPQNAAGFLSSMKHFGLKGEDDGSAPKPADFAGAKAAYLEGRGKSEIKRVEQADSLQISTAAFGERLGRLREGLNAFAGRIEGLPVSVNTHNTSPGIAGRSFEEHFRAVFNGQDYAQTCFFSLLCGRYAARSFNICVFLDYQPTTASGLLPFGLLLWCRHSKGEFPSKDARFLFEKDGRIIEGQAGGETKEVHIDDIVKLVMGWFDSPEHWATAS